MSDEERKLIEVRKALARRSAAENLGLLLTLVILLVIKKMLNL